MHAHIGPAKNGEAGNKLRKGFAIQLCRKQTGMIIVNARIRMVRIYQNAEPPSHDEIMPSQGRNGGFSR